MMYMTAVAGLARRSAAALVAAAMLVSLSAGGQRWFRCTVDAQVRSACCCGSSEAGQIPSSVPQLAKLRRSCCCEVLTAAALGQSVTAAPASFQSSPAPSTLLSPLLATLVPPAAPDRNRRARRARIDATRNDYFAFPILLRKQSLLI
jgi:hypothetical protein